MKKLWCKIKKQLIDKTNIIIFSIVIVILSGTVWIPYLLAIVTQDQWWWGIGSICWAFWLGPFTPFLPLCLGITILIRKLINLIKRRNKND